MDKTITCILLGVLALTVTFAATIREIHISPRLIEVHQYAEPGIQTTESLLRRMFGISKRGKKKKRSK